jgi:hypothetical protein
LTDDFRREGQLAEGKHDELGTRKSKSAGGHDNDMDAMTATFADQMFRGQLPFSLIASTGTAVDVMSESVRIALVLLSRGLPKKERPS